MTRARIVLLALAATAAMVLAAASSSAAPKGSSTPRWVLHTQRFSGGISAGVRAMASPFHGRLYVTYTKFHFAADGSSDYCPIQLAYTDAISTTGPSRAVFKTPVVPDDPGAGGLGESANQHSVPQVQRDGTLDISYVIEECDTGIDHGFRFQKSTNGGASFLASPVHIDKPGQFVDNPDPADLLPPTVFRAPTPPRWTTARRSAR